MTKPSIHSFYKHDKCILTCMKFHLDIWTIKQILIGVPEGFVPKVPQYNPAHWGVTEIHGQEISQSVGFLDVISFINRQFCCPDIKTSFCKLIYSVLYTYRTVFFWEFKSIVLLYDCTIFFLLWRTQPCRFFLKQDLELLIIKFIY